jgi:Flp pilus assembly protein TadD
MGRSLALSEQAVPIEQYGAAQHNPFQALGTLFEVERRGRQIWHKETHLAADGRPVYSLESKADYVLGSGTRGRSYLSDRDGYLFQTPISWYTQKHRWDLSPGFSPGDFSGRPVPGTCLFCHTNRTRFREGSLNHYEAPPFAGHAIGCERCHGPGEKHVASSDPLDIATPGPKRMPPELCQAVCEQCHLEGAQRVLRRQRGLYDFRPGMPLQEFWRVFVRAPKPGRMDRAVSHVEQMRSSRCYQGGAGERPLLCTSCHDPHAAVAPEDRVAHYRSRCLVCHHDRGCSLPRPLRLARQAEDSCIACHMARFPAADIVHTAGTDHRIPRRPAPAPEKEDHSLEEGPLTPFHRAGAEDAAEVRRDLGLALVEQMKYNEASPELVSAQAAAALEEAVRRDAEDVPVWEALGLTLLMRHQGPQALQALEKALACDPDRETALAAAATLAWNLGDVPKSLRYWRRVVALNPWLPSYRASLTQVLLRRQSWDEARAECRQWLRLDPASLAARQTWIELLLREGNEGAARAELARLEAANPSQRAHLRAWFDQRTR